MAKKRLTRKKVNNPIIDSALRDIYDKIDSLQPESNNYYTSNPPVDGEIIVTEDDDGTPVTATYTGNEWLVDINSNFQPVGTSKGFKSALGARGRSGVPINNEAIAYDKDGNVPIVNSKKQKVNLKNDNGVLSVRNSKDSADAVVKAQSFQVTSAAESSGGAIGYANNTFIGNGEGLSIQSVNVKDADFTITCNTLAGPAITVVTPDSRIKVGQLVKSADTPKSGLVVYVGEVTTNPDGEVTIFVIYRDGAQVNTISDSGNTSWSFKTTSACALMPASEDADSFVKHQINSGNQWVSGINRNKGTVDSNGDWVSGSGPYEISNTHFFGFNSAFSLSTLNPGALELFGTSASLKMSYDASNYGLIDVASDGHVEIESVGTDADMTLNSAGDIELNSDGGFSVFKDGTSYLAKIHNNSTVRELSVYSSTAATMMAKLAVDANAVTTLSTINAVGSVADFTLDVHGDITLDSETGIFKYEVSGTEFSSADSAYAGMILGMTIDGVDEADQSYDLTTSFAVPDANKFRFLFITPPSELVEISCTVSFAASAFTQDLFLSISNHATYGSNSLSHPNQYETAIWNPPARGTITQVTAKWIVASGNLEAIGSNNTLFVAAKTDNVSGTPRLHWGGDATEEYSPLIIKVTALPLAASISYNP